MSNGRGFDDRYYGDESYDNDEGSDPSEGQRRTSESKRPPIDLLDDTQTYGDYSSIPDILQLNNLCANAVPPQHSNTEADTLIADESWEPVREWLRTHTADDVRQAAEQRGESAMTALHFACRNQPPSDVLTVLLSIAGESAHWPDAFGWLPIHYACACGADAAVIKALADFNPDTKTTVDRRGRTPLHFALGNQNAHRMANPDVIAVLSSTGAASYEDDNGMLPLHYACAYGASEESLHVLTGAFSAAMSAGDRNNRTPLHFALSNAGRKASPGAVRHLLLLDRSLANSKNGGPLPLRVLVDFANAFKKSANPDGTHESVERCLEYLLNASPKPTADFFTALQALPEWLSEKAVVTPSVQVLLNEKTSQRFPTAVLLLDFYFLTMIIVSYSINVIDSIRLRFKEPPGPQEIDGTLLSPLYMGAAYFLMREVIQMVSLISLQSFHTWVYDPSNWLNVVFVFLILYWTIQMHTGSGDAENFRIGSALSVIFLWIKVLAFLKSMLVEFAVFVGGVFYVVQRLFAFLISLGVILVGFAQMFNTVYQQTSDCREYHEWRGNNYTAADYEDICNNSDFDFPFCNFWDSFLNVYTMLLGEVNEGQFKDSAFATALFIVFMFLVVILLANVLIAVVTDSYKVIQDERAAIVFWTNRLGFVAEMDAIANGPWRQRLKSVLGSSDEKQAGVEDSLFGEDMWKRLMDLFEEEALEGSFLSVEFWAIIFLRIITGVIIVPLWILTGVLSAGWLWPPQIREYIFTSTVAKHSSETEREAELRKHQVFMLQKEVAALRESLIDELTVGRTMVVQMKLAVADRRADIVNEMKHIKRITNMLFEQSSMEN